MVPGSLMGNPGGDPRGTPALGMSVNNPGAASGAMTPPTFGGVDIGLPGKGPSFVPISKVGSPVPVASAGSGGMPIASANNSGAPANPLNPNTSLLPHTDAVASTGSTNQTGSAGAGNGTSGGTANGNPNGGAPGSPGATGGTGSIGGGDGSGPADPLDRPLPALFGGTSPKKANKAPAPSPLSKMLGNKDFIITIDCYADRVTVFPGSAPFRWTSANTQATDQALAQFVANLIERRQASVRPGEPPYRPLIRFQVSAEGLRSYYHVYPLLERLGVPMTRENVAE
jgi:hypothetical protein